MELDNEDRITEATVTRMCRDPRLTAKRGSVARPMHGRAIGRDPGQHGRGRPPRMAESYQLAWHLRHREYWRALERYERCRAIPDAGTLSTSEDVASLTPPEDSTSRIGQSGTSRPWHRAARAFNTLSSFLRSLTLLRIPATCCSVIALTCAHVRPCPRTRPSSSRISSSENPSSRPRLINVRRLR